jgi:nonsense-mediated mRNA decay protein 3
MNPQYYEGILQLRNPTKEVIRFVKDQIKKRKDIFISKEVMLKNGRDVYLSSQKFLLGLGRNLQNRFGGQLKTSRRLHTISKETSKQVYRVTVLFRLPLFKTGDIITYRGEKLKINSISKKIFAQDIKTGKKFTLKFEDFM